MNPKTQRIASVLALLLVFCISQAGMSFAAPDPATAGLGTPAPQLQDAVGILTTVGNKPIMVNEAASTTGATILSGVTIETPEAVGATVTLGRRGSLEIEQYTKLTLNFQVNSIKVQLLKGCVTLNAKKGTTGEIETTKGLVSKTDPKTDAVLRVCHPDSVMEAGAVIAAPGLNLLSTLGVLSGPAAAVAPAIVPGSNPSISSPE